MSLKKELLSELSKKQLKEFADSKDIHFTLSKIQKKYYSDWKESEKIIDILNDKEDVSIGDVEDYIKVHRESKIN